MSRITDSLEKVITELEFKVFSKSEFHQYLKDNFNLKVSYKAFMRHFHKILEDEGIKDSRKIKLIPPSYTKIFLERFYITG